FHPGTTVFVNHPGSVTHHDIVGACVRVRRAGFNPVPHIAARRLASFTQASDFVQRAAAEAGVTSALVIGGDPDHAMGPFPDARDLLSSGLLARNGLRAVLFAGYPEGHPRIAARVLDEALRAKLALARGQGLEASVVTQFSFDARPILDWLAALKADDIARPVRVGIAGPATVATLAKFAVRCGIGASLRALARGHTAFARILAEARPDALIEGLAAGEDPRWPIDALHIFTFGGVRRTAEWINGYLQFKTSAAR
ncbi:MAG: methylenetetrahydrofolate reductase, partial [Alphaproteobacteria bacterium]|nr:methylenetetrahydrofolate reductase [Alphaproteobacteria bacterium]